MTENIVFYGLFAPVKDVKLISRTYAHENSFSVKKIFFSRAYRKTPSHPSHLFFLFIFH